MTKPSPSIFYFYQCKLNVSFNSRIKMLLPTSWQSLFKTGTIFIRRKDYKPIYCIIPHHTSPLEILLGGLNCNEMLYSANKTSNERSVGFNSFVKRMCIFIQ